MSLRERKDGGGAEGVVLLRGGPALERSEEALCSALKSSHP